jgi:hypothetical protein
MMGQYRGMGLTAGHKGREQKRRGGSLRVLACWITMGAVGAGAQQVAGAKPVATLGETSPVVESLPAAPVAQADSGQAEQAGQAGQAGQATGVIFGIVTDSDGALVEGARVVLSGAVEARTTVSDASGRFQFLAVVAGEFRLSVTAKGLAQGEIAGTLKPGGIYTAPAISLRVATANTEVNVSPETQYEIAEEEVKTEEKQRVLGIVPNYFVTYEKNPMPLAAKQKFSLGFHAALDPTHFLFAAGVAGAEQMSGTFSGFGPGPEGFGKRYGAALATSTTSEMLRGSVFPSIFRQDPRYYYKGTGTNWERTKYALESAVICKGDNGRTEANYSAILAGLTAGALSNFYYAPSDRHGAALTFESGVLSVAGVAFGHIMQEFVFRRFTTHAPLITQP